MLIGAVIESVEEQELLLVGLTLRPKRVGWGEEGRGDSEKGVKG